MVTTRIAWKTVAEFALARTLNPHFESQSQYRKEHKNPVRFILRYKLNRDRVWAVFVISFCLLLAGFIGGVCWWPQINHAQQTFWSNWSKLGVVLSALSYMSSVSCFAGAITLLSKGIDYPLEFKDFLKDLNHLVQCLEGEPSILTESTESCVAKAKRALVNQALKVVRLQEGKNTVPLPKVQEELTLKREFAEKFDMFMHFRLLSEDENYGPFYTEAEKLYEGEKAKVKAALEAEAALKA